MDFLIPLINGIECIRIFRKERKEYSGINAYSIFFGTEQKQKLILQDAMNMY